MASIPSKIPSMVGMGKIEKKLIFTQVLLKHKQVEEWPGVSRQITTNISLMLSKKTHSKIKSVYFEEWQQAIANGQVSKIIKLIHNVLTLKTSIVLLWIRLIILLTWPLVITCCHSSKYTDLEWVFLLNIKDILAVICLLTSGHSSTCLCFSNT